MSIDMENKNNRKAIQILRGSNDKIAGIAAVEKDTLLDGQLLYNRDKNYITVGNKDKDEGLHFSAAPIRVRELGGVGADDSSITNSLDDTFKIAHDGSTLKIWNDNEIVVSSSTSFDSPTAPTSAYLQISRQEALIKEYTYNNNVGIGQLTLSPSQIELSNSVGSLKVDTSSTLLKFGGNLIELATASTTIKSTGTLNLNSVTGITSNSKLEVNSTINGTVITASNRFSGQLGEEVDRADIYCEKINASGQVEARSFNATSDARLKTNIKPLTYHDSILDIPVCEYDWKESGKHAIGFIAQDLKEVYPELVDENEEGILSIKETKLVYLLIEEVKKLKEEIQELKR